MWKKANLRRLQTLLDRPDRWCKCCISCRRWCDKNYFVNRKGPYDWEEDYPCSADRLDKNERWLVTEFEILVMKGLDYEDLDVGG